VFEFIAELPVALGAEVRELLRLSATASRLA